MKILEQISSYFSTQRTRSASDSDVPSATTAMTRERSRTHSTPCVADPTRIVFEPRTPAQLLGWLTCLPTETKILSFRSEINVTDAFLAEHVTRFTELETLDLGGVHGLTIEGLSPVFRACPNIQILNFNGSCNVVNNAILAEIAECLPNLRVLRVAGGNEHVTNDGLISLARHCRSLENVDFTQCDITGAGLAELMAHCPIKLCNLSICNKIEPDAFRLLAGKPTLVKVSTGATKIGLEQIREICEQTPQLKHFNIMKIAYLHEVPADIDALIDAFPILSVENPQGKLIEDM
jgi:hypothetical protein